MEVEIYTRSMELQQAREILEQKNAELIRSHAEIESFSYSVSHDLRAPLRAVSGYAGMLAEDYGAILDAEGKRILSEIQKNSKKMGALIDDLLALSKLGRKEMRKTEIDMKYLIEEVLSEINRVEAYKADIKIAGLHSAVADYSLMRHVVINLLSNAIKYSSLAEKPIIEITSRCDNDEVIYTIKDNGVGFDMAYVHKLFGVFQRLHSPAEFEGTGVGLAIVKRVIERHGGRVWAEGKLNEGAAFSFTLPKSKEILNT
jgi:light-regulated signal transduction histidine kinase (bacteriophytochrome)